MIFCVLHKKCYGLEEAGLYFTPEKGLGQRYTYTAAELTPLRELLNRAFPGLGNAVSQSQMAWLETYTYDRNGNRATKTTPWGTVRYDYDAENRLIGKGDIVYTNDKDGNILTERGLRYEAGYEYNGQNRMVYSEVTSHVDRTHTVTRYAYDALGRRTLTESVTGQTLRTLYDGKGFEVIREGETFINGSLTTRYAAGGAAANGVMQSNQATGERYRWISEDNSGVIANEDGYTVEGSRYGGRGVTLYGKGEAVAVSYSSSTGSRSTYLGKDVLGSVRTATTDTGAVEDRYEYDAFGAVYQGDLSSGMNLGYLGKPYDTATGLYNYGYRDYKPQAARFTTVDPIRDGNNWFAYVNNDPVNWVDLWGLLADDPSFNIDEYIDFGYEAPELVVYATRPKRIINILGRINAAPMTLIGHVTGTVFTLISMLTGNGRGSIKWANNAVSYTTGLSLFGESAVTLGNVIIYTGFKESSFTNRYDEPEGEDNVNVGRHEEAHTYQYQRYGIFTIPLMIKSSLINTIFRRSNANSFFVHSSFENAADDYAQGIIGRDEL